MIIKEPYGVADYGDREVRAVRQVLVEIGQVLGIYRSKFVVVGGAVPWLLLEGSEPPHIGTLDIDLNLDPDALGDGEYATLVEVLESKGYLRQEPDLRPFQLSRSVKVDDGEPITVLVDLLMPRGARPKKNRPVLVEGLRVQGISGSAVALRHAVQQPVTGVMPDGRSNTVIIQVASIPALLVMKGYALVGRDKMKDAYDIYYAIRNFPGGTEALAQACLTVLNDEQDREESIQAFRHIAEKFHAIDSYGPMTVRRFLEDAAATQEFIPEQIQNDAFFQIRLLLDALKADKIDLP